MGGMIVYLLAAIIGSGTCIAEPTGVSRAEYIALAREVVSENDVQFLDRTASSWRNCLEGKQCRPASELARYSSVLPAGSHA